MLERTARARHRPLYRGLVLATALAVLAASLLFAPPLIREMTLKNRISRATSATIVYLRDGFAWEQGKRQQDLTSITLTSSAEVAQLVNSLRGPLQSRMSSGYEPAKDKCFDGFRDHNDVWPRVVFTTPDRKEATIYLPYGDCGVWPGGLPWGWGGGWPLVYAADKTVKQKRPNDHPRL